MKRIILAILVALILGLFLRQDFFYTWQLKLSDGLYGRAPTLNNIVIVGIDDKSIQSIGRWPWNRTVFSDFFEKAKNSLVTVVDISFFEKSPDDETFVKALNDKIILSAEYSADEQRIITPIAGRYGLANVVTEQDGITRTTIQTIAGVNNLAVQAAQIIGATPAQSKILINYGPNHRRISFVDATEDDLTNKIVFVGATAPDLQDYYNTPIGRIPGVEIHANALQTILTKKYLQRPNKIITFAVMALLAIITSSIYFFRLRYAIPLSLILLAGYIGGTILAFNKGTILNIIYPSLTILAVSFTNTCYLYLKERAHKKQIIEMFGKQVSPQVAHILINEKLDLEGEEREITVLFADVRGFTSMSEKQTPKETVNMLNNLLGGMSKAIMDNNGVVDKYIGDCIMAIFGAPHHDPQHAENAIKAAKAMANSHVGIGVNTGRAIVGNMGSKERLEYTAIGDTVNVASRFCSKAEGGQVIIGELTKQESKVTIKKKLLLELKGKAKKVVGYLI